MAVNISISPKIREKLLNKHDVDENEVEECFLNMDGGLLADNREEHKTTPPTRWFISETNAGRRLKIVFIEGILGAYQIKTAYEPNENEEKIYEKYAK